MKNPNFRSRSRHAFTKPPYIRPAQGGAPFVAPPQSGLGAKKGPLCTFLILPLLLLVSGPARADDEDELADVVAAVYKPRGTTFLSGDTAITRDGMIFKSGDTYLTPRGAIFKSGDTYLAPRETVFRSGDTFLGSRSTTFKSGDTYLNPRGSTFRSGSVLLGPDK